MIIPHTPDAYGIAFIALWIFYKTRRMLRAIWKWLTSDKVFNYAMTAFFIFTVIAGIVGLILKH